MPLYFIENRGQLDSRVAYYVHGRDTVLYFTADGVTLALTDPQDRERASKGRLEQASLRRESIGEPKPSSRWVVKLDFVGANPHPKIVAGDPTTAVISYFKGPRDKWNAGLATYSSILYSDLWPGIDLVYSGTAGRLKYSFLVKPGVDPAGIRLAYRGVKGVRLNEAGQLEVETGMGGFEDDKPYAYQEVEGRRVEIKAAYALDRAPAGGSHRYGFKVGSYDRSKPLVLDPASIVYCGYIGGNGDDEGEAIAVDGTGAIYVTGYTTSAANKFPVTVGPDLTFGGGQDAFVAKVNAFGTALVYCGYIGGSGDDEGLGIAVDSSGNAYVTGVTNSPQATFPVTVGPGVTYKGGQDAFVAKVNAAGTALVYCGYISGSDDDFGNAIAVDSSGNAYVTGITFSTGATFPVTVGPGLTQNGLSDAFVAKVNATGTGFVYCGYIGGSNDDGGYGIAVDGSGNAYVTGYTYSTEATFPVITGPHLTQNGLSDAFVAKVNAAGNGLVYCGFIGGSGNDQAYGLAVDSSGNAYVTGFTNSTEATFPVTVGPGLTYSGGSGNLPSDAFVAKVNAAGTGLVYCGYIGGSDNDGGNGITVDSSGNAYVTGFTASTEATFPLIGGPQLTYNGGGDAFVAKVNAAGTALVFCGYLGGSANEAGLGIALGSSGAYVTGFTASTELSFPVRGGPDLTYNSGPTDVFVAKVTDCSGNPKGDVNGDGAVNVSDIFYLINYLFANGPAPICSGDVNGDGQTNAADVFYLINYIFVGGPPPH
jgi:hypothetical protein